MNLRLGTVQFGQNYGINGQKQPSVEDAVNMLDYATQNGIHNIDTAFAYGTAEDVVGEFLKKKTISRDRLNISSKLVPNIMDEIAPEKYESKVLELIKNQLKRLNTDYLDVYLYHSARYVHNEALLSALQIAKKEGLAKKVGVSVYDPDEVRAGLVNSKVEFMQFPYSIFDQRMLADGIFTLPLNGTEIDTRSAFIQGLIIMNEDKVPSFLEKAKPVVRKIDEVCAKYGVNRVALAMSFVKQQKSISSLVFGVDNMEQLKQDIESFNKEIPSNTVNEISKEFAGIETDIVMPSLWKK